MGTHICINPDIVTVTQLEKAYLDVSCDPKSDTVKYDVYGPAGLVSNVVPMNAKSFATSPDLFAVALKKGSLVVATTTDPTVPSVAILRQELGPIKIAITIPTSNVMLGTSFELPVGDLHGGAFLYVGNAGGVAATGVLQYGSATSAITDAQKFTIAPLSVAKIPIQQAESNVLFTITNDVQVVVQAVLGTRFVLVPPVVPAV